MAHLIKFLFFFFSNEVIFHFFFFFFFSFYFFLISPDIKQKIDLLFFPLLHVDFLSKKLGLSSATRRITIGIFFDHYFFSIVTR